MGDVTLAGDTTFGGTGRWDIRGGAARLSTEPANSAYTLTKVGPNFIALVGLTVDPGLGDINVQEGTLQAETSTTLGDPAHTLTVSPGATFSVYNLSSSLGKTFVLNGTGTNVTLNCANGTVNSISGAITLNGDCLFSADNGAVISFNGTLSGSGSLTKVGGGTDVIASGATGSYAGGTLVSNGTMTVDGTLSGTVAVNAGGTLAGSGTASGAVTVLNGSLAPGGALLPQGTLTLGSLVLSNSTSTFELSKDTTFNNDQVVITGSLTLDGTNRITIVPPATMSKGDVYTLFTYGSGSLPASATNGLLVSSSREGFTFSIVDPSTTSGALEVRVDTAIGSDTWTGAASAMWDTTTTNWTRNSKAVTFNDCDFATFDDTTTVTNVSLAQALEISGITMNNFVSSFTFEGPGSLGGPGGLHLAGSVPVIFANGGTNDFSGPISIDYGVLQVGNGGTNGNLGTGTITNNGARCSIAAARWNWTTQSPAAARSPILVMVLRPSAVAAAASMEL